ncbi:MAG: hypothetical protein DRI57_00650 [Deltaproteobacteria bacterium]|nr:MAG: hypothetical protein DRI57_00650 [Deltaproteobacteria bacterium]
MGVSLIFFSGWLFLTWLFLAWLFSSWLFSGWLFSGLSIFALSFSVSSDRESNVFAMNSNIVLKLSLASRLASPCIRSDSK